MSGMKVGRRNNKQDEADLRAAMALLQKLIGEEAAEDGEEMAEGEESSQDGASNTPAGGRSGAMHPTQNEEAKTVTLNLSYVKSLNLAALPDLAVKKVGTDLIRHPVFVWGNPDKVDIEQEYFDRQTNLWDAALGKSARPLTWDHMQDDTLKASPVIGKTVEWEDDDVARWAISQLDRAHRYRKAVDALIEAGALGSSSDSALQYIIREPTKSGATYIKQWPWFASALTTTPAEPRTKNGVDYFKSLGIEIPSGPEAPQQTARAAVESAALKSRLLRLFTE